MAALYTEEWHDAVVDLATGGESSAGFAPDGLEFVDSEKSVQP